MSSNWDGRGQCQGVAEQNAQAAQQRSGEAPRRPRVSLDGAKEALVAFNIGATAEHLMEGLEVLLAPLPDGAVKTALRSALLDAVSARLESRRSELKQDLLDAAAFFVR